MPSPLDLLMVLVGVGSNFREPLSPMFFNLFLYYIKYLIIVVISMEEGFYEEDMIGCITFNYEIISYTICLDVLYLCLGFSMFSGP